MSATEPGESILASRMAPPSGGPLSVSVSVHDSTRLQWSVVVPLRAQRQRYRLEAMLTFPSHVFAPHSPWLQLQSFARLKIPSRAREGIAGTVADVQREALGATREPLPFQALLLWPLELDDGDVHGLDDVHRGGERCARSGVMEIALPRRVRPAIVHRPNGATTGYWRRCSSTRACGTEPGRFAT